MLLVGGGFLCDVVMIGGGVVFGFILVGSVLVYECCDDCGSFGGGLGLLYEVDDD